MSSRPSQDIYAETLAVFGREEDPYEPLTTPEVADALGANRRTVYKRLKKLVERGELETKEVGSRARVWWRPPTDGRKSERRLEVQRDALRQELDEVYERIDDAVYALDEEWRFTHLNEQAEQLLGNTEEGLRGEVVWEAFPEAVEMNVYDNYHEAMETQEPVRFEEYFPPHDRWYEVQAYPSETGLSVHFLDVTERKERERDLEQYETVIETVTDGVYAVDAQYRFTMVNEAYVEMTGYDREELLGSHISTVVDDEVVELGEQLRENLLDGEADSGSVELEIETADGERLPVESRYSLLPFDDEFRGSVGIVRDVTERTERRQELERYEAIIEAMGDPVYALDTQGRFTFVNQALTERSGYDESELLGQHVSIGMGEEDIARTASVIADLLADDPGGSATVEYEVITKDGERIPVENHISLLTDEDGTIRGSAGVLRDVTERNERERELEESEQRYRTLVDNFPNGAVTLVDDDLRYLTVGGTPIEEAGVTVDELEGSSLREILPPEFVDALVPRYIAALEGESSTFEDEFGGRYYQFTVLPVRDESGDVFAAMGMSQDVTDRKKRERKLERQREQLAALNHVNDIVRDVTDAVIEQSTREEIEEIVCERLAESDSYLFAWIGDVDLQTRTLTLRTEAGVEGYLDGITISIDPEDERSRGPTGRAILQREIQVTQGVESSHDSRRDHVGEYDVRSTAAIPIIHDDTLYGVLNVYAERPDAFTGDERAVIGQLGEIIGHAIAAVERKRALMSDEVVELEFRIRDFLEAVDVPVAIDGTITFERTVPIGDGAFLGYGTATGDTMETVEAMVASDAIPHWESVSVLGTDGEATRFEVKMTAPPALSTVVSRGGYIDDARLEDGDYYMRIRLTPSANVRHVADAIKDAYPAIEMVTQRQVTRDRKSTARLRGTLFEELTDRQRAALEAGYYAGFFSWPRENSGEDVADSLDIGSSTFHQHVRKAEKKLLDAVFAE